jgi:hypothetical protein
MEHEAVGAGGVTQLLQAWRGGDEHALDVSTDTIPRDWKFVTSWLKRELGRGHGAEGGRPAG